MAVIRARQAGFTYLALLFLIAVLGAVQAAVGTLWSAAEQREKERELLFRGNAIRKAIANYYERTPGTVKRYPHSFDELLKDNRQLATVRHLRRLYTDPMTAKPEWGIVRASDGGVKGVYSLSTERVLKRGNFTVVDSTFAGDRTYADWRFVYEPPTPMTGANPATRVQNPP